MADILSTAKIAELLGPHARTLLEHRCTTISRDSLHLPGPDFIDRVMVPTDRKPAVLGNLQRLFNAGRLGGTGYISIFPVDQDIEHAAGASFAMNPSMFDPETIVRLALESGCSGVASTFGLLGAFARQ